MKCRVSPNVFAYICSLQTYNDQVTTDDTYNYYKVVEIPGFAWG